jgi:hypothetical protein
MSDGQVPSAQDAELGKLNAELEEAMLDAAIDVAGIVDPTPISDSVGAARALSRGDYIGAGLSLVSMVPYIGDALGKTAKGARTMARITKLQARITKLLPKGRAANVVQKAKNLGTASATKCVSRCPKLAIKAASPAAKLIKVQSADVLNAELRAAGRLPCWKPGTEVITEIVPKGTRFQMVVSRSQAERLIRGENRFGSFATSDVVSSQRFARRELAILPEFKSDVSRVVTVETTADQVIHRGIAGKISKHKGGAQQVQFEGGQKLKMVSAPTVLPNR